MAMNADLLVDRRTLRRKLTFWRAALVVLAILAVLAIGALVSKGGAFGKSHTAHIARYDLTGMITYDDKMLAALKRIEENDAAKGLLLYIDSPGGSTAGSEAIYAELRRIAAKKPVVAQIATLGASGAYIAAMGCDEIVATKTSLVGSIGVLVQWAEFSQLAKNWGVSFQEIKTSPLKAAPNFFEPPSDEAKAALKAIVDDSFDWFKGIVTDRRKMNPQELAKVSDGRVFTGRQALALKLIDEIGDQESAKNWLLTKTKLDAKTPIRLYKVNEDALPAWLGAAKSVASLLGVSASWLTGASESSSRLDGLVSLWQPSASFGATQR